LKSNPLLGNIQGLAQLTTLILPSINGDVHLAAGPYSTFLGLEAELGGVTIESNPALTSLAGLQNITIIPVAYILLNQSPNDFCPFKASINGLSTMKDYDYTYIDDPEGMTYQRNLPALTLINNGNSAITQDV
jgi:hypothetical protein